MRLSLPHIKRYGGYVNMGTAGNPLLETEAKAVVALIAQDDPLYRESMILQLYSLNLPFNGIIAKTAVCCQPMLLSVQKRMCGGM